MRPNPTQPVNLEGRRVRLEPLSLFHPPVLLELAHPKEYPHTLVPKTEEGIHRCIQAALRKRPSRKGC